VVSKIFWAIRPLVVFGTLLMAVLAPALWAADEPAVRQINYPSYIGQVLKVSAGDKLQVVLVDGRVIDIQLAGVQAPVSGEPFAPQAREWLRTQLSGQIVSIDCDPKTVDSPRLRCVVYPDEREINFIALRLGIARTQAADLASDELSSLLDAERYLGAESIARSSKLGLWATSKLASASP